MPRRLDLSRPWNDGKPVWNRGTRMKPATLVGCAQCATVIEVTDPKLRYRIKRGERTYCSVECRKAGTARLISAALMGHPGHKPSPEGLARRVAALKARQWPKRGPQSLELRLKRGRALSESPKARAHLQWMQSTFKGEASPHWKGGKYADRPQRPQGKRKRWRDAVLERDNYTCQWCGRADRLHADHIRPYAQYPELQWNVNNGRTLCVACHRQTDTYGGRREFVNK